MGPGPVQAYNFEADFHLIRRAAFPQDAYNLADISRRRQIVRTHKYRAKRIENSLKNSGKNNGKLFSIGHDSQQPMGGYFFFFEVPDFSFSAAVWGYGAIPRHGDAKHMSLLYGMAVIVLGDFVWDLLRILGKCLEK